RILANFLRYVHWPDFQSLALTCTTCRNVLHHPELRDAVLSAYVPGYQCCRRYADADVVSSKHVDIQFIDLIHFMASQQLALHHYPTLALATLSGSWEPAVLEEGIPRYVMLCQAHSRMVLLLQALIHSSITPVPPELEDPSVRYRDTSQQSGRELVFPAPLSFFSNDGAKKKASAPKQQTRRFSSMPSAVERVPRSFEGESMRRSLSRMSILGRNRVPLPPPSADPFGLKLYSGSWRSPRRSRASVMPSSTPNNRESLHRRPMRESVSATDGNQSSSDNGNSSPHSTVTEPLPPFAVPSPHDIRAATSRLRAPILRVYVPCSEVDHRAITACETQLEAAGLWQHLSVGDIVCNLGYLPPADVVGSSSSDDLSCDDTSAPESWLIFDGTGLLPYTPLAILPLSEPLSLPSPFYYAHITFPPANPRFVATLPREKPELSLDLLPARVRSPHSPDGFARIRKYVWVARLKPHVRPGLGERWRCEWILEGEGTKEGRQSLLDALRGGASAEREWQIVMERCTAARVWLRSVLCAQMAVTFLRLIKMFVPPSPVAGSCQLRPPSPEKSSSSF
ncbi:hypothetical protein BC826DRAFT_1160985, partial [Russula brevipes]